MTRKRRMDKWTRKKVFPWKFVCITLFVLIVLGLFTSMGMNCGQKKGEEQIENDEGNLKPQVVDTTTDATVDLSVWIPDESKENSLIEKNVRIVDNKLKLNNKVDALIKLLVAEEIIPKNTHLIGNIKVERGVAIINLSNELKDFSGSASQEAGFLNSLAKTLINKKDKIDSIKILIGGEEVETIGGHIELTEPYKL